MARKDIYHEVVKTALQKDGWTITDDPLPLFYGNHQLYADLGLAERLNAEKSGTKIAVEIKSFISKSAVYDLYVSVGQYNVYRDIIEETNRDFEIYLAIPKHAYEEIFSDELGKMIIRREKLQLIIFDEKSQESTVWIK